LFTREGRFFGGHDLQASRCEQFCPTFPRHGALIGAKKKEIKSYR
jgi:hypothetical protein